MNLYLDTSLLVAGIPREPITDRVLEWLDSRTADELVISDWVVPEVSAALSSKLRMGQITATERTKSLAVFARLCAASLNFLPITGLHFRTAARFADRYSLGIRASDALHLALCSDYGAALCTLDIRLGSAGPALGVRTVSP